MEGNAPTSPRTGVPGWLTNAEEDLLAELAAQLSPSDVFVGIGVEYGRSMSVIAHSSPSKYIYGVELNPLPAYDANMKEAGLTGRTKILIGDSAKIGASWDRSEIAMLFVDGAHEYKAVLADLTNWTPFVKQGGMVVLHDVACQTNKLPHALHYEVKRALDTWHGQQGQSWEAVHMVDTMMVFKRLATDEPEPVGELPYFENEVGWVDETPGDLDAEVHEAVEPERYDEPAPPPKTKRGRPKRK